MKKLIFVLLVGFVTTTNADVLDPVKEAKTKDWMISGYPLVEMAMACKLDKRFDYLKWVLDNAYRIAGTGNNDIEKTVVDMWWANTKFDPAVTNNKTMKTVKAVKQLPDHPEVIKGCATFAETVNNTLARR